MARREYRRALHAASALPVDVASSLPDADEGVHIRGPEPAWGNRFEDAAPNPGEQALGRRTSDVYMHSLATKKLVFLAVFVVEVLCLAGDTLFLRSDSCF